MDLFDADWEQKGIELFKDLIHFESVNPPGNEAPIANYLAQKFADAGIVCQIMEKSPGRCNLVARLSSGSKRPPIALISHLDVVPADMTKWTYPPFSATESDGFIWGRGTLDTKQLTAMQVMAILELSKRELNRDVIFVASADEEAGSHFGMEWLAKELPELQHCGLIVSEGGGFPIVSNGRSYMLVAAGEKGVCQVALKSLGDTGHASCPPVNQSIYHLAEAVRRLTTHRFEEKFSQLTRHFLIETGLNPCEKEADRSTLTSLMQYQLFDTLSINHLQVGEATNVIPKVAEAIIEFRLLPGTSRGEIEQLLNEKLIDLPVQWTITGFEEGYESDTDSEILRLFEDNARLFGFAGDLLPFLALGRTDGRFLCAEGASIFGFSPVLLADSYEEALKRVHNDNERISEESIRFGLKVFVKSLLDLCVEK